MHRSDLWSFAVSLYGAQDVSKACLFLQEESAVDVPVLLFAAWSGRRSVALSQDDLRDINGTIGAWREEVILPLRVLRKRLKSGPRPAPDKRSETLRNAIKAAELSAERIELKELEAQGRRLSKTSGASPLENMLIAVRYYRKADLDERSIAAVNKIAAALTFL
jgi:uncharacterized protein (TIGR02444 family)